MSTLALVAPTEKPAADKKPFICHGEHKGKACGAKLSQAEAWLPESGAIRKVAGRWPSVKDLSDHTYCGRCSALGRKAGLRFHHYQKTVVWMEQRRVERAAAARQVFGRYLPQGRPDKVPGDATSPVKPS